MMNPDALTLPTGDPLVPVPSSIDVTWRVRTGGAVAVPRKGRTPIQVVARRDAEINLIRVTFLELPPTGGWGLVLVGWQELRVGARRLPVEFISAGQPPVEARQGGAQRSRACDTVMEAQVYSPHDFWVWAGRDRRLVMQKGQILGVQVWGSSRCRCQVEIAGN